MTLDLSHLPILFFTPKEPFEKARIRHSPNGIEFIENEYFICGFIKEKHGDELLVYTEQTPPNEPSYRDMTKIRIKEIVDYARLNL